MHHNWVAYRTSYEGTKQLSFQNRLSQEQSLFKSSTLQSDTVIHASYVASEILAKRTKPFSDGEITDYLEACRCRIS
jgi:hypothetical protein